MEEEEVIAALAHGGSTDHYYHYDHTISTCFSELAPQSAIISCPFLSVATDLRSYSCTLRVYPVTPHYAD